MSNTIKLKRGSGSDPSASDLVVGEIAVRTDSGKLFTKKDDNSVTEIGGGSGAIDDNSVTGAKLSDNLDIPDDNTIRFGDSQDLQIFHDSSNGNSHINESGSGSLVIKATNTYINSSSDESMIAAIADAQVALYYNGNQKLETLNNGVNITGSLTLSGTVDGRDVAADGTKLDGIESNATADQSNSEIKTAYEANSDTNAFTDALLSKLNGIAASATNVTNNNQLTNGAGYITATLTNEQVQDIVGGMVSGNTESGITVTYQDSDGTIDFSVASQTDQNFTTTLKNKLDGIASGATNVTNNNQLTNGAGYSTFSGSYNDLSNKPSLFSGSYNDLSNKPTIPTNNNQLSNGAGYITSANGGNAATLDSIDSSQFLRSDQNDVATGAIEFQNGLYVGGGGSANYLDDYEEGDWTPSLLGGSNGAGGYSIRDGSYVKIGRLVHVNFGIAITSKGSMSGDLNVGSLPFTVQHIINDTSIEASGICGYWKHVDPNSSTLTLVAEQDSNIFVRHTVGPEDDPDQMSSSHIDSDFTIRGSITYFTSQ